MNTKIFRLKKSLTILLILLTLDISIPDLNIKAGWSGETIRIKSDGTVEPSDAPIKRNGNNYILINDIEITLGSGIVVEKDNIIIDGNNYILKGGGSDIGVLLHNRIGVEIRNVKIQNFGTGISLSRSSNNKMIGNNIESNSLGIYLDYSSNNEIIGNRFIGCGLGWFGDSYNNVVKDNAVNNKPLFYLENEHDKTIRNVDVGQVILVKCSNIIIEGLNISKTSIGIGLLGTSNSIIRGSNIENNIFGILLWSSSNNEISRNKIKKNRDIAIYLYDSSNNKITENDIENNRENNQVGILFSGYLSGSSNNEIIRNNIEKNGDGILLWSSSNNRFYLNNFINNIRQIRQENAYGNFWDNGTFGNHWSDYQGIDINNDGIGDAPYIIDATSKDRYPLVKPFSMHYSPGLSTKGKRILFDFSHVEQYTYWNGYYELSKELENEGYHLYQLGLTQDDEIEITSELLGYFDILVLPNPQSSRGYFTPSEISAIVSFIARGGGLLVLGGDYPMEGENYPVRDLINNFGIGYEVPGRSFEQLQCQNLNKLHPIMKGINELYVPSSSALIVKGPAMGVAYLEEKPIIAVSEYKEGRVAVISCEHIFSTISKDNLQFGLNLFHWLSEKAPLHKESIPRARIIDYPSIIKTLECGKRYEIEVSVKNLDADELSVIVTIPNEIIFNKTTRVGVGTLLGESKNLSLKPGEEKKVSLFIETDIVGYCYLSCYLFTKLLGVPLLLDGMNLGRIEIEYGVTQCFINVSSAYGTTTGSGKYPKCSTITISVSLTQINHENWTRHVFSGWYEDSNLLSRKPQFLFVVKKPVEVLAAWRTEYFVQASSIYGTAMGSRWYAKGATATVSVFPTFIEKDFFTNYVFEGWMVDGSIVSTSPTYSFIVDGPVTLIASWGTEVNPLVIVLAAGLILLVVVPTTFVIAKGRKPTLPRAQSSLPSPPTPIESETEREIKKYEEYLEKLEQLKKEGEVSEKVYKKLKEEYEKKIEELIGKMKK